MLYTAAARESTIKSEPGPESARHSSARSDHWWPPFFLAYGLLGAAYIGTEALTALTMYAVKLVVYGGVAVLTAQSVATGLGIGVVMVLGTYLGKCLLARLPAHVFPLLVEAILVISGLQLLGVHFGRAATDGCGGPARLSRVPAHRRPGSREPDHRRRQSPGGLARDRVSAMVISRHPRRTTRSRSSDGHSAGR